MSERPELEILGELLGLLAHDLRNPLSALHSNLGFLRALLPPEETEWNEAVGDGLVSCDGLAHIIDNIDLLGQTLRQLERPSEPPVDAAAFMEEAVRSCGAMAQSYGVRLDLTKATLAESLVKGSHDFLLQALSNLIRNSIQHAPPGTAVAVLLRDEGAELVVEVRDQGGALPETVRETAFTAIGQVASKSVPNGRYSRGLGLYSAKLAALAGGGDVRAVESAGANAFELVLRRP